jgi:hypothetical protein
MFFVLFLLDDGRIRIREVKKHTDPDPQHWVQLASSKNMTYLLMIYLDSGLEWDPVEYIRTLRSVFRLFFPNGNGCKILEYSPNVNSCCSMNLT